MACEALLGCVLNLVVLLSMGGLHCFAGLAAVVAKRGWAVRPAGKLSGGGFGGKTAVADAVNARSAQCELHQREPFSPQRRAIS
jgi:hypothetical protein